LTSAGLRRGGYGRRRRLDNRGPVIARRRRSDSNIDVNVLQIDPTLGEEEGEDRRNRDDYQADDEGQRQPGEAQVVYVPARLGEKFLQIRAALDLTQQSMLERLDLPPEFSQSNISAYERGTKEPPIFVIMKYAEVANVWIDVLVEDSLDLPHIIPSKQKHEGLKRKRR